MKKYLTCLMCVILMLTVLTGCPGNTAAPTESVSPAVSGEIKTEPSDMSGGPADPMSEEPPPYNATIEYGEPDAILEQKGPLLAYIRFPAADGPADQAVADWARETYQNAKAEIDEMRQTDDAAEGEINIHFDSYLLEGRYVGIVEKGEFNHSHLAHAAGIVKTFNMDLSRGVFLDNADILDPSQSDGVLLLLRDQILAEYPDTEGLADNLEDMDGSWLDCLAIGPDGVIVVLERGAFLPGYLNTLTITLPYDELGAALVLGAEPISPPTPEPTPEPTPPPYIPPQNDEIDPSKPMVALTFDDGPGKQTERVLDLLEQYGGRATFFTIGNLVNTGKNTVLRASGLGCEIAGHSWDHKNLTKLSEAEIKREILDTGSAIEAVTGTAPRIYRPPYGAVNETVKSVSQNLGFAMIYWSIDPLDWKNRNADSVYSAVMNNIKDKSIVLSHDLYDTTVSAMERIIPELVSKGYQLVTVSELMSYSRGALEAGKVYNQG